MIGIFDSGYGGLTIMRAVVETLPQYSYVYLGDNARAPYGTRSQEEIFQFTKEGVEYLFAQNCELVLLACNTASAGALRRIQQEVLPKQYPDRRVLGIVVPTVEQITGASWQHAEPITTPISDEVFTVGVLATPSTVESRAYKTEIHKRNRSVRVIQQACPSLAMSIEEGKPEQELSKLLETYVGELIERVHPGALRAVLLGCTHYELISDIIHTQLPEYVRLYHQPSIVAKSLQDYLVRHPEIAARIERSSQRRFLTTGDPATVSAVATRYYTQPVIFNAAIVGKSDEATYA